MADPSTDDILNQLVQQLLAKQGSNPLTDVSTVLGNAAQGRAMGVSAENSTRLGAGDLSNRLFQSALDRYKMQAAMPNFRADQAVKGDQIANTQDVVPTGPANVMSHVVNFTGGKRPSNLGPNARSAGSALSSIGASNIGKDVLPTVPEMPKMADGGALGNILGGGALATSVLGSLLPKTSGGGGNILGLGKDLINWLKRQGSGGSTVTGDSGPEAFGPVSPGEEFGLPQDPSGGTGVGPGMADYYEWLKAQQNGGGGMGDQGPADDWTHP